MQTNTLAVEKNMPQSTTWRRIRVRNGGQIIEMLPAVADAMVNGGTASYVNEKGQPTDFYGKPLNPPAQRSQTTPVETASVTPKTEKAAHIQRPAPRRTAA